MTQTQMTASERAWAAIDEEKRRDRLMRRVSRVAWTVTFILVLIYAAATSVSVFQFVRQAMAGAMPWGIVAGIMTPFVLVLGALSVLIATLSTIAIFYRMRTASLAEIQLRLAALEEMVTSQGSGETPR